MCVRVCVRVCRADFSSGCRGSAFSGGDLIRDPPFLIDRFVHRDGDEIYSVVE